MKRMAGWGALGIVLLLAAASWAAAEIVGPGFHLPFDFAPHAKGGVAVLEGADERVTQVQSPGRVTRLEGLVRPRVLATDESGLLVVLQGDGAETWHLVAFQQGQEVWSSPLQGEVLPSTPVGAGARDGVVWVVDKTPPRLLLFAFDGAGLGWVDLSPWARSPFAIALGPAGEAFVTDPLGPAVLAFSPSASYVGRLDLAGTGITRPTGVSLGPGGRLWVSDGVTGRVSCLDAAGRAPPPGCDELPARFQDPLRLSWREEVLWVLEGIPGRVQRVEGRKP